MNPARLLCAQVAIAALLVLPARGDPAAPGSGAPAMASENYTYANVNIGGGGFVTGIIFNPAEKGLCYVRTDVGGAYRWNPASARWEPLLDWVSQADWNLQGVESLASDPLHPARVYIAAGTYARSGNGEILRSSDYGRTWLRTPFPSAFGGNEAGRNNGERLAVDPNDDSILFFGTRHAGLWRSADFGATWARVEGFPIPPEPPPPPPPGAGPTAGYLNYLAQPVGVNAVRFDPSSGARNSPTPAIYATVSTTGPSLFRSTDAGRTWSPVPGQPLGLRPTRTAIGADGFLYLSYGREPGPNMMTDGAVWRLGTATGAWTDITPERPTPDNKFGYGSVIVDPQNPRTVLAATWNHRHPFDEIFRSRNGGRTWTPLLEKSEWDHSSAPYTRPMHHHWLADVEIDPFDSDHAIFPTGYGIWVTHDIGGSDEGRTVHWSFDDEGIEETVPLVLCSPPAGAHLVSGVGDIDGFVHDDFLVSPAGGAFAGPRFKDTTGMAFAWDHTEIFVRCGNTYTNNQITAAYSTDGARTWRLFAGEPPGTVGTRWRGAGSIAISPDGKTVVWTPLRLKPYLSHDWGATWQPCANTSVGLKVVADTVNSNRFYAYDAGVGQVLVSDDGAQTFRPAARGLPVVKGRFGWAPPGDLHSVPGEEGVLWIAANRVLYRSADGGATFARVGTAAAGTLGFGAPAPGSPHPAIFIVGESGGVAGFFRSDDDGATWVHINDDRHQFGEVRVVAGDPRVFGRIYFSTGGRGIFSGDRRL